MDNYYRLAEKPTKQIKDELGWWNWQNEKDAINGLIAICMALCDKIEDIETRLKN